MCIIGSYICSHCGIVTRFDRCKPMPIPPDGLPSGPFFATEQNHSLESEVCVGQGPVTSELCGPDLDNVNGCKMIREPTFIISAPRRVRPLQVLNVFVAMLHLEYTRVIVRVSIVKDNVEYTANAAVFDEPSMKIIEIRLPKKAVVGRYSIRARGTAKEGDSGSVFTREMDIEFDGKQASIFVQMSNPVYKVGETVRFRVIPVKPNLMAARESVTIYIEDGRGVIVRRWQGQQQNAGGFIKQSFKLTIKCNYGNWAVRVDDSNGYIHRKTFIVHKLRGRIVMVPVSAPAYIFSDAQFVNASVYAYHWQTGRRVRGNATVTFSIQYVSLNNDRHGEVTKIDKKPIVKHIDYFDNGTIDISFTRKEILEYTNADSLAGMEFRFGVVVVDWQLGMGSKGFAITHCHKVQTLLQWVGDRARTFQPDSTITLIIAVMQADGSAINETQDEVSFTTVVIDNSGGTTTLMPREVTVVGGYATLVLETTMPMKMLKCVAKFGGVRSDELRAHRHYSPSEVYITVSTSTKHPRVNEYMIFHVKTSVYVPKIYYQIVAQGNILLADELRMISRQKTISIALSRDMIPTARIIVFCMHQPNHIISDSLNFFVNGTRLNPIQVGFNRGKDFTRHTIELNVHSEPGAYAAFSVMTFHQYERGLTDGLSEHHVIDELLTYDQPANRSYSHKMRLSHIDFDHKFFQSKGHGIDTASTFRMAGLALMTDADPGQIPNTRPCESENKLACNDGTNCYSPSQKCDKVFDCLDGVDESGCPEKDVAVHRLDPMSRANRHLRFYDSTDWAWQEHWVKPDGRVDFRVKLSHHSHKWVINAFSLSPHNGFGILPQPAIFDGSRLVYIIVDAPKAVKVDEQVGIGVTIFNNWYGDDFIEILLTLHDSKNYKFVHVEEMGIVDSFNPRTSFGEHTTLIYMEAGESRDVYVPVLPVKYDKGFCDVTISATSFLSSDTVTVRMKVAPRGVENSFYSTYLIDLISTGSVIIPEIDLPMPQSHIRPEQREFEYIPGTGRAIISITGDIVGPGIYKKNLISNDVVGKPHGALEGVAFSIAYNTITLQYKKDAKQLTPKELTDTLNHMNIWYQRLFVFMFDDYSFMMFTHHPQRNIWLTSFVAKTLSEARSGEWEHILYIPLDLIDNIVTWICRQQNATGAFVPLDDVYDIKMLPNTFQNDGSAHNDSLTLTAYVLIALSKIQKVSGDVNALLMATKKGAVKFLSNQVHHIDDRNVFQLAITTYAISLSDEPSVYGFKRLKALQRQNSEKYWSDLEITPTPWSMLHTVKILSWRNDSQSDAYAVSATAYGLMASLRHGVSTLEKISIMTWLQSMRYSLGGFLSTQDTLVAMEALNEFAKIDKNRNVFDLFMKPRSTATVAGQGSWRDSMRMTLDNYTLPYIRRLPNAWGYLGLSAVGSGRAVLGLANSYNVEYPWQIVFPDVPCYNVSVESLKWGGRNFSLMYMTACARWHYTKRRARSGLSVMQIELPSGYRPDKVSIRRYSISGVVKNLKHSEYKAPHVNFYFHYLDDSETCINFFAERHHAVAKISEQHLIWVYDYYEPSLKNVSLYTTVNLFHRDLCHSCASYQCPYCPGFNSAEAYSAGQWIVVFTTVILLRSTLTEFMSYMYIPIL